jgi:hypothetical protein
MLANSRHLGIDRATSDNYWNRIADLRRRSSVDFSASHSISAHEGDRDLISHQRIPTSLTAKLL